METRKQLDNEEIKSYLDVFHWLESDAKGIELAWSRIHLAYLYLLQLQLLSQVEKDKDIIYGLREIILNYLQSSSEKLFEQEYKDIQAMLVLSKVIRTATRDIIQIFENKQQQQESEMEFIKNTNARRVHYFFDRSSPTQLSNLMETESYCNKFSC